MKDQKNTIYIDVSDVVAYAAHHNRVSGIQRVVLNIIRDLSSTSNDHEVRCAFHHPRIQKPVSCAPAGLLGTDPEFDAAAMKYRLQHEDELRVFPSKNAIKRHLNNNKLRGVRRILEKLRVYAASLVYRSWLETVSLRTPIQIRKANMIATLSPVSLEKDDRLVLLGATWSWPTITHLASSHKQQGGKVIQMIYDLIPMIRPDFCHPEFVHTFTQWLNQSADYSTQFICISEHTANDLRKYLALRSPATLTEVKVIPLAHEFPGVERNSSDLGHEKFDRLTNSNFVLFVGTIEPRKNCLALLKTWLTLIQDLNERPPFLVLAGKEGWHSEQSLALIDEHPELSPFVIHIKSPTDSQLAWLYANCKFTVFPSLYEGWGLPVGEAAWFGKYTVASTQSSVPEVLGDLIDYVNPEDIEDITNRILFAIKNPPYVANKEATIRCAPLRTWQSTTEMLSQEITT